MTSSSQKKWKEFYFPDVFVIKNGFYNKKPPNEDLGEIPFIGASEYNNGVTGFCTIESIENHSKTGAGRNHDLSKKIFEGNCICVTNNGSVGNAFFQSGKFTCSHDVNPLYLRNRQLTKNIAMFLIAAIEQQKVCFAYSRKWRPKRMKKSKLLLPVNESGKPDFDYMESYIKKVREQLFSKYKNWCNQELSTLAPKKLKPLDDKEWREFFVTEIFNHIQRGKRLTKANQIPGNIPYISSTALNNGVDNFIGNTADVRIFETCLTIANSGSVGATFFHPYKFVASDHVTALIKKGASKHLYLFLATALNQLASKYNFNREINDARMKREKLFLPVNEAGEPDYAYMEQYMVNMEYQQRMRYLEYKDNAS